MQFEVFWCFDGGNQKAGSGLVPFSRSWDDFRLVVNLEEKSGRAQFLPDGGYCCSMTLIVLLLLSLWKVSIMDMRASYNMLSERLFATENSR